MTLDHLTDQMREFLGRQQMMFLSAANAWGEPERTFRSGKPGFVRILGRRRLCWREPDTAGPLVGFGGAGQLTLFFVELFKDVMSLHISGRATTIEHEVMRARYPHLPEDPDLACKTERWLTVRIDQAYLQSGNVRR